MKALLLCTVCVLVLGCKKSDRPDHGEQRAATPKTAAGWCFEWTVRDNGTVVQSKIFPNPSSFCRRTRSGCSQLRAWQKTRSGGSSLSVEYSDCVEDPEVWCFDRLLGENKDRLCSATIENCEERRLDVDPAITTKPCASIPPPPYTEPSATNK